MNRTLSKSAPSNLSALDVKLVGAEQAGTALLYAVAKADVPAIELMLKDKPQLVNFGDYDKRTPLHVAASGKPRHSPATSCRPARPHLSACNWHGSGRNEVAVRVEPSSVAA